MSRVNNFENMRKLVGVVFKKEEIISREFNLTDHELDGLIRDSLSSKLIEVFKGNDSKCIYKATIRGKIFIEEIKKDEIIKKLLSNYDKFKNGEYNFNLDSSEIYDLLEICQYDGLIDGLRFNKVVGGVIKEYSRITLKGKYLAEIYSKQLIKQKMADVLKKIRANEKFERKEIFEDEFDYAYLIEIISESRLADGIIVKKFDTNKGEYFISIEEAKINENGETFLKTIEG